MDKKLANLLAFYLPQYHPIPENNEWWGNGFTEWTNVSAARPRYRGHCQPHIPADLGFYDLRLEETRLAQAALAAKYGVNGFCYYHYWFNGKRLLGRPLDEVLESKKPDFPFCLCWANENWTRAWDGLDRQVLIRQDYTKVDSLAHLDWLANVFRDNRYIKVKGNPLLLIYRYDNIPDVKKYFADWQESIKKYGFNKIYLCAVKTGFTSRSEDEIISLGFDSIIDFQPNSNDFPVSNDYRQKLLHALKIILPENFYQWLKLHASAQKIVDYKTMVNNITHKEWPSQYIKYPCIFPSWDNTPRRKTPTIIYNDNAALYAQWMKFALSSVSQYPEEERFVFINAWNEWAEGCHLEPDKKNGRAFLEATLAAVKSRDDN